MKTPSRRILIGAVTGAAVIAVAAGLGAGLAAALGTGSRTPSAVDVLALPTEPWWGGSSYYAAWDRADAAGWSEESFFPVGVFYGKPQHARALAAAGINTYVGAEHDGSPMSEITDAGVSVIAQPEWTDAEVGENPLVVGWHVSDECDMGLGGCDSADGESGSLAIQREYAAPLRAKQDGRFLQANFGNGVLGTHWSPTTMPDHVALVDVTSVDKYALTSPHVRDLLSASPFWPTGRDPRSPFAYGWQQDRMETFAAPAASKPNWVLVETARPFLTEEGAGTIDAAGIRAAVWNALIHGAAGVVYFQHNNDDTCGVYSLVECGDDLTDAVASVNAQIADLAPVLNSPSYVWNAGAGLDAMVKAHDGFAYVFAMTDGGTGPRMLRLPPGAVGPVEVVGSDRVLEVDTGTFTDDFPSEDTVRIYRIALGGGG